MKPLTVIYNQGFANHVDILVAFGQSNLLGDGDTTFPVDLYGPRSDIKIWYSDGVTSGVYDINPPFNTRHYDYAASGNIIGLGAMVKFSDLVAENQPGGILTCVIKISYGGQGISSWLDGNSRDQEWEQAISEVIAWANARNYSYSVKCLLFINGESDCTAINSPLFESRILSVVSDFRASQYVDANCPVYFTQLRPDVYEGDGNAVYVPTVRQSFVDVVESDANFFMINPVSIGALLKVDKLHYETAALLLIGTAANEIYEGNFAAPSQPGSLSASNVAADSFDITWTASVSNIGTVKYEVLKDDVLEASPIVESYSFSGLTASTSYNIKVRAVGNNGLTSTVAEINQSTTA